MSEEQTQEAATEEAAPATMTNQNAIPDALHYATLPTWIE